MKTLRNKYMPLAFILFILSACSGSNSNGEVKTDELLNTELLVQKVYDIHGGDQLKKSSVSFQFRDHHFEKIKTHSGIEYKRTLKDSTGTTTIDKWIGNTVSRTINGKSIILEAKKEHALKNSLNSVFYFAFLPQALKDPAVNHELIGEVKILGQSYYKLKVTFDEKGGGDDHQDIFLYWINKSSFTMDYMAYKYFTNEGGVRFRQATNPQEIKGIRFQDYYNFKPIEENIDFNTIDKAFENGQVELVSEICLEKIAVNK